MISDGIGELICLVNPLSPQFDRICFVLWIRVRVVRLDEWWSDIKSYHVIKVFWLCSRLGLPSRKCLFLIKDFKESKYF